VNAPEADAASRRVPFRSAAGRRVCLGAALIVLGALVAYANSFGGPFLFDDIGSIPENATIRHLWPIWAALSPPVGGFTVSGRPVLNLSLAVNYALGGTNVWGYHAANLLIHILAGLTLFGIVRRTLVIRRSMGIQPMVVVYHGLEAHATLIAFTVALLWTVHPLQTESVTLVIQRAESLMGLFYLLTLYGFIRYAETGAAWPRADEERGLETASTFKTFRVGWGCLAVFSCLLGMATKEVMVTAPVIVFLYDRTFVSGTFREAWRRDKGLHAGLASTWLVLAWLVSASGGRAGTAGFGAGVAWWAYALTQFRAIAHYLRLSIWPHPLVSDYGRMLGGPPLQVIGDAVVVIGLVGATIWALAGKFRNMRALGFAGAWFFLILAPSSSVVPVVTEIIAEHRMYLPLAAVVAAVVVGGYQVFEELRRSTGILPVLRFGPLWIVACMFAAVGFAGMTYRRNVVYRSNLAFWADAALKVPDNPGAHNNLGNTLAERGFLEAAMAEYHEALRLDPDYSDAHTDLGNALVKQGHFAPAIDNYLVALRFRPADPAVHYGLGLALMRSGRSNDALEQFEQAVRLKPDSADAWSNLAELLVAAGRWAEAADAYAAATRLRPDNADTRANYGNVLAQLGRRPEAMREYRAALILQPAAPDVHNNLGSLLAESGRFDEAKVEFQDALRLKPDYQAARDNLDRVNLLEKGESGQ